MKRKKNKHIQPCLRKSGSLNRKEIHTKKNLDNLGGKKKVNFEI